tara:strand:+ start:757 stop:903 length:147 start_codon:yes stop_codon:yes gene_type:complete
MEVASHRNDGWTRAHYMILLNKVREELKEEPYEIPHIPGLAEDDEFNF